MYFLCDLIPCLLYDNTMVIMTLYGIISITSFHKHTKQISFACYKGKPVIGYLAKLKSHSRVYSGQIETVAEAS